MTQQLPVQPDHSQQPMRGSVPAVQQPMPEPAPPVQRPSIRQQGAWGLWWLTMITFSVYYFIWYQRVNDELAWYLGRENPSDGQWWAQLIPIYNLVGLSRTAKRLNAAHAQAGTSTRVSPVMTWLWSPSWFGSQVRYVQRRQNLLADVVQHDTQRNRAA